VSALLQKFRQTDGLAPIVLQGQSLGQAPALASPSRQKICVQTAPAGKGAQIGAGPPQSLLPTVSAQGCPTTAWLPTGAALSMPVPLSTALSTALWPPTPALPAAIE
jgi:hypothetical protein